MEFRFYIEDRNENVTAIDDPIGWDGLGFDLKRDKDLHGVFFDYQDDTFEYGGVAARILRNEYRTFGIEGIAKLIINYVCGTDELNLYIGKFFFGAWDDDFGEDCAVKLPIEMDGATMTFRNRMDQKVNLETLLAFDGTTALPSYSKLPFTQTLPGKSIFVQDYALNDPGTSVAYMGSFVGGAPGGTIDARHVDFIVPGYDKNPIAAEIGGFNAPTDPTEAYNLFTTIAGWTRPADWAQLPYFDPFAPNYLQYFPPDIIPPIVNYDKELGQVYGDIDVTIEGNLSGEILKHVSGGTFTTPGVHCLNFYLGILKADKDPLVASSWDWLSAAASPWSLVLYSNAGTQPLPWALPFTFNRTLHPGDRIYFFYNLCYAKYYAHGSDPAFDISYFSGSFFKVSGLSHIPDSDAKLFMVNEAFSRITEAITDDQMRAYSVFYGRTDSQPYAIAGDGCASLTAITPGLFVRRMEQKLTDRPPLFNISFKDMIEGLRPIHNIGVGIEADPMRTGYSRLRIEAWYHFYTNDVVLECRGIRQINRKVRLGDHVATFTFGYDKWEAEEYNGIDEFLTKREYRTELKQTSNSFSQLSSFIASGFALEITRRKGNTSSTDWRYDKETFVIAMKRISSGDVTVNQGDINAPAHIVDPATIYNFELRPSIMAMRWLPQVLASYKTAGVNSKIIFTDGEGNYYAEGWSGSGVPSVCRVEYDDAITEKQDLSPQVMNDPNAGLPIWENEDIVYEFPMTVAEFKLLRANPNGLIYYETDGLDGYGWINTVKYKPEAGTAEFTLIPKRVYS